MGGEAPQQEKTERVSQTRLLNLAFSLKYNVGTKAAHLASSFNKYCEAAELCNNRIETELKTAVHQTCKSLIVARHESLLVLLFDNVDMFTEEQNESKIRAIRKKVNESKCAKFSDTHPILRAKAQAIMTRK